MKKNTSGLAIAVAVVFSILLFPFIFITGVSSGLVFSLESVVAPDREEDLYRSLVDNGGVDWVYEEFISGIEEGLMSEVDGEELNIDIKATEFFPKGQVETIIDDLYHTIMKGEEYNFDFSYQKEYMEVKMTEYFEANVETEMEKQIRAEYGEAYDSLSEAQKQELLREATEEARRIFDEEKSTFIEEEIGALEKELSAEINSIYDMPEYQDLKELEKEYGYSLTDRTELCAAIRLAGYVLLGLTGILIVVLLLCHLFRPSGFFTAGAFTLLIGGIMMALAKGLQGVLLGVINSEISVEYPVEEMPNFVMPMIKDVLGWCTVGFEKVGKIGLMAAVVLVLVGILLLVIRNNKAEAEPMSATEMQ